MQPEKYLGSSVLPFIKGKLDAGLATKQDTLVSGTNIKTVNGQSILGTGNIELEIPSGTVQTDTKIADDKSSTVTIVKTTAALNDLESTTDTNLPLPVASKTQAGVINPSTYETIYDTADALEAMEGAAVAVSDLPADAGKTQLDAAWKQETGKDTVVNGAKILDITNGKTWTYYSNTQTWYAQDNTNPTIEINAFTNTAAGTILGSDVDGKVYAESDGTGSVKGWDTVKSDISTAQGRIDSLQSAISQLDTTYVKQDGIKTVNGTSLLGSGDVTVQEVLVSGTNIKTVNGTSILGAGNIQIDVPTALTSAEFESAWNATA